MPGEVIFTVSDMKTRLDKAMVAASAGLSRSRAQRHIEQGCVTVNGSPVTEPKHVVRQGDKVVYLEPGEKREEPVSGPEIKTLYNNHGLLIIDKPAGMIVHKAAGFKGDSLADLLLAQYRDLHSVGQEGRYGIVHRLDRDTSGIMLIARTPEMYAHLKDAFAQRRIRKEYLALACGKFRDRHGLIDTPVGKSSVDFRKYTTKDMVTAKDALTEYWVEELFEPTGPAAGVDGYSLLRVRLHTGRTHQIRVHCAFLGHPLAGDKLYGGKQATLPGLRRQFLHACQIEVQLPDGAWIEAHSDLPADLRETLEGLGSKEVHKL